MSNLIGHGNFADVFDLADGTVLKVYRRIAQTDAPVRDWDDHEFMIRQLFATEVRAYERLQSVPHLAAFIPRYFGPFDHSPLNLASSDPRAPLVRDCAFRLERIQGHAIKVEHAPDPLRHEIDTVLDDIHEVVGDIHVWDSSCFIPGPRTAFCVIDFAIWEELADAQLRLHSKGRLSPDDREQFRVR